MFYLASRFLRSNFDDKLPRLFGAHGQCVHPCAQRFNTTRLRFFAISQPFFSRNIFEQSKSDQKLKKSVWLFFRYPTLIQPLVKSTSCAGNESSTKPRAVCSRNISICLLNVASLSQLLVMQIIHLSHGKQA